MTKSYKQYVNCKENNIPNSIEYLFKENGQSRVDIGSALGLIDLFQRVARGQVIHAIKTLDAKIACGIRPEDAW